MCNDGKSGSLASRKTMAMHTDALSTTGCALTRLTACELRRWSHICAGQHLAISTTIGRCLADGQAQESKGMSRASSVVVAAAWQRTLSLRCNERELVLAAALDEERHVVTLTPAQSVKRSVRAEDALCSRQHG